MKFTQLTALAPLSIRLAFGAIFIAHGWQKFMSPSVPFFASIGIPMPEIAVPVVATIELVGGIALILGIGSRIASIFLTGVILGAIFTVKIKMGFIGGYEFELSLLAGLISLIISGPGSAAFLRKQNSWFA